MDDGKFWIGCWSLAAGVIAVATLTIGGCTAYKSAVLRDMVEHGADPMRAACALDIGERKDAICGALTR